MALELDTLGAVVHSVVYTVHAEAHPAAAGQLDKLHVHLFYWTDMCTVCSLPFRQLHPIFAGTYLQLSEPGAMNFYEGQ